jgi:hypothetical protein
MPAKRMRSVCSEKWNHRFVKNEQTAHIVY